jgi:hypothetical protein
MMAPERSRRFARPRPEVEDPHGSSGPQSLRLAHVQEDPASAGFHNRLSSQSTNASAVQPSPSGQVDPPPAVQKTSEDRRR